LQHVSEVVEAEASPSAQAICSQSRTEIKFRYFVSFACMLDDGDLGVTRRLLFVLFPLHKCVIQFSDFGL
jgi:hypothetical protein